MPDEQMELSDTEILRSAARMLESLADELTEAAGSDHVLFAYKSALTLYMVATTLRGWAVELSQDGFIQRLVRNEAILRMVKHDA
jgi:hypothetical protein